MQPYLKADGPLSGGKAYWPLTPISRHRSKIRFCVTPALCRGPPGGSLAGMTIERAPCVYILASGYNGSLYVGVTSDLIGRIMQHRAGTFDGHTKKYRIYRLVYFEVADTMDAAIAREKQLKRYPRDWKRNLIERENPVWNDLAVAFGLPPLAR
ncbi:GIY-YIG nuclease family protein [Sphingomonas sp. MMS24-J45]|uniref:GIY-YIG nuclease family protein n=1 Tax=Sphingomonas sp. MMS24-J45 TaxID=3238806 RepID=UPI003850351D